MLGISTVLFLFQTSVDTISTDGTSIYSYNGSLYQAYDVGGYELEQNIDNGIPELPAEITTESSSGFTDIFQSISTWFTRTKTGKIISGLYYGVPNLLKGMGLEKEFVFALSAFWHLIAIFSFILFMRGVL